MKIKLLTLDKPNINGRVYSKEVIQKAIADVDENRCFVAAEANGTPNINLERVCAKIANIAIEEDCLVGDIQFLNGLPACDPNFETLLNNNIISVRPCGIGRLSEDGTVVSDYELNYFFITNNPA